MSRFQGVISLLLTAVFAIVLGTAGLARPSTPQTKRPIRESEISAVILAIEDEIYALNLQAEFIDAGKVVAHKHTLNVYFQPEVIEDSRSWVVYKLMPGGEVYRMYEIGSSGRIYLHLKPGEFRTTQPSYPTVYMDDDVLCKLKRDWIRRQFIIDTNPSAEIVSAARARQLDRKRHMRGPAGEPPEADQP